MIPDWQGAYGAVAFRQFSSPIFRRKVVGGEVDDAIKTYIGEIENQLSSGKTTEHTHRPALKEFIETLRPVIATNEPGKVECGAPDFRISSKPSFLSVGYIECKDIGAALGEVARCEQLKRYRRSLNNLVLTDYIEFQWFLNGKLSTSASIGRVNPRGKVVLNQTGASNVLKLLTDFLNHSPEPISKPKVLAERMARLAHLVRDVVVEAFSKGKESSLISDLRRALAIALLPDFDQAERTPDFADMYSQTIVYGLFAARCNHSSGPFKRLGSAVEIPKTNPFLRKLFEVITGPDLSDEPYVHFIDDLVQVLDNTDVDAVLRDFGQRTKRQDPVIHFYETFLAEYDPKIRETRGVYYTPEPVVSFMVRSLDHLLKARFGLTQGLADNSTVEYEITATKEPSKDANSSDRVKFSAPKVLILDPACGTGTFLYLIVDIIREQFLSSGNAGMWAGYVKDQLLRRLFGFELLMAPYAVAHFKLAMQLAGRDLDEIERTKLAYDFLTVGCITGSSRRRSRNELTPA